MKRRILEFIRNQAIYSRLIRFLKRIKFHKGRITLLDVLKIFLNKLKDDEIVDRANAVAFNFTIAIFPAIIFLFTLIPYFNAVPDLDTKIMDFLQQWMPPSMYEVASSTIIDIVNRPRGGLLSFGFLASIFLATTGMVSLMKAFNSCYKTVETRGFLKSRLIATSLTFMLAIVFVLAVVLLVVGQVVIVYIDELGILTNELVIFLLLTVRFIVMLVVFLIAISFIYYYAPAVHQKWNFFSIGSIISAFLCLAVSYGFSSYISNFGTYNKFYGSIGALIALMIWFFILSIIMLVGYEINASVHKAKMEV